MGQDISYIVFALNLGSKSKLIYLAALIFFFEVQELVITSKSMQIPFSEVNTTNFYWRWVAKTARDMVKHDWLAKQFTSRQNKDYYAVSQVVIIALKRLEFWFKMTSLVHIWHQYIYTCYQLFNILMYRNIDHQWYLHLTKRSYEYYDIYPQYYASNYSYQQHFIKPDIYCRDWDALMITTDHIMGLPLLEIVMIQKVCYNKHISAILYHYHCSLVSIDWNYKWQNRRSSSTTRIRTLVQREFEMVVSEYFGLILNDYTLSHNKFQERVKSSCPRNWSVYSNKLIDRSVVFGAERTTDLFCFWTIFTLIEHYLIIGNLNRSSCLTVVKFFSWNSSVDIYTSRMTRFNGRKLRTL